MENIISFLSNNIVIAWIAPVVTSIIATIVIKLFSIRKKNKEIKNANQRYADAIRPYIIQGITINEEMIHGIRNAISVEMSIPEKYLYSDDVLRNILMYDITTTRFMTEEGKNLLIQKIIEMFEFKDNNKTSKENEATSKKIKKKQIVFGIFSGILGLIAAVIVYCIDPEKANDPNSIALFVVLAGALVSLCGISAVIGAVLDMSFSFDMGSGGILSSAIYTEMYAIEQIAKFCLRGRKKKKNKNQEEDRKETS